MSSPARLPTSNVAATDDHRHRLRDGSPTVSTVTPTPPPRRPPRRPQRRRRRAPPRRQRRPPQPPPPHRRPPRRRPRRRRPPHDHPAADDDHHDGRPADDDGRPADHHRRTAADDDPGRDHHRRAHADDPGGRDHRAEADDAGTFTGATATALTTVPVAGLTPAVADPAPVQRRRPPPRRRSAHWRRAGEAGGHRRCRYGQSTVLAAVRDTLREVGTLVVTRAPNPATRPGRPSSSTTRTYSAETNWAGSPSWPASRTPHW